MSASGTLSSIIIPLTPQHLNEKGMESASFIDRQCTLMKGMSQPASSIFDRQTAAVHVDEGRESAIRTLAAGDKRLELSLLNGQSDESVSDQSACQTHRPGNCS
jgi:hypothetical protein